MFKYMLVWITFFFVASMFVSCSDSGSSVSSQEESSSAKISVLHASPDAPKINIIVNNETVLSGVDYAEGGLVQSLETTEFLVLINGEYVSVGADTYSLSVESVLPDGEVTTVIEPLNFDLGGSLRYSVIAVNSANNIEPLIVEATHTSIGFGKARVQIVHASASAPAVDIYVTVPNADINQSTALGTLSFKEDLGAIEFPVGEYQIRITPQDSKAILFDSGAFTLSYAEDLVIAALPNVGIDGVSPVQLAVLDGNTSSVIMDKDTPASFRVIHNSPGAPAVDIVLDNNFEEPLVSGLRFSDFTSYINVPENTYNVKVVATGTKNDVIDADLSVSRGSISSIYAINNLSAIEPLLLADDNRKVSAEAKVRIVHGSTTAGSVDIYLTEPYESLQDAMPAFSEVPFKANTGYIALATGEYQIRVTPTGSKDVIIDTGVLSLEAGKVYTAVARDAASGESKPGLILLDDFNEEISLP